MAISKDFPNTRTLRGKGQIPPEGPGREWIPADSLFQTSGLQTSRHYTWAVLRAQCVVLCSGQPQETSDFTLALLTSVHGKSTRGVLMDATGSIWTHILHPCAPVPSDVTYKTPVQNY